MRIELLKLSDLTMRRSFETKKILAVGFVVLMAISSILVSPARAATYAPLGLPAIPVTMEAFNDTNSYFNISLSNVPSGYDVSNGMYPGWCVDRTADMERSPATHQVTLLSSLNPPGNLSKQKWDMVNYILNHRQENATAVQEAIWYFVNFLPPPGGYTPTSAVAWAMVNDALAHGTGFVPGPGQIVSIICSPVLSPPPSPSVQISVIEIRVPSVAQYTLTVNVSGQGSVAKSPNQTLYTYGTNVTLTANPAVGWSFAGWSGDVVGASNPVTINMTSNKTVTTTFTQNQYTLTVNVVGNGSVSKSPNQTTYTWGTNVSLTAVAGVGWSFGGWSGDAVGMTNPVTINMTGNKAVTATFVFSLIGDIALTNLTTCKDGCTPMPVVCKNFTAHVNVTVLNEGNVAENVTVTAYANTTVIGTQSVLNLDPHNQTVVTFLWNTTGYAIVNYTLSAYAAPVPGEVHIVDNVYNYTGFVRVTIIGDINGDDKCEMKDVGGAARGFGKTPGLPGWNPNADLTDDHKIDMKDIAFVARHFGENA